MDYHNQQNDLQQLGSVVTHDWDKFKVKMHFLQNDANSLLPQYKVVVSIRLVRHFGARGCDSAAAHTSIERWAYLVFDVFRQQIRIRLVRHFGARGCDSAAAHTSIERWAYLVFAVKLTCSSQHANFNSGKNGLECNFLHCEIPPLVTGAVR